MIPDLTNPYLSNGSLSPSARTVSVLVCSLLPFSPCLSHSAKKEKTTTLAVRKSSLCTTRPPYSLRLASQGVVTTSLFFFWRGDIHFSLPPTLDELAFDNFSLGSKFRLVILFCFEWFMAAPCRKTPAPLTLGLDYALYNWSSLYLVCFHY